MMTHDAETGPVSEAIVRTVGHYLERVEHLIDVLERQERPDDVLAIRLAPDMFDTGFNFAIAIQFGARALCPPAGLPVPAIPERFTCETLRALRNEVAAATASIDARDLTRRVDHRAGEAELSQAPADYVSRFALPNMIFHLTLAYAGLRQGGVPVGKADFDGLHRY